MSDEDAAIEQPKCVHKMVRGEEKLFYSEPRLGTYEYGITSRCELCGYETYQRTRFNNWSGD